MAPDDAADLIVEVDQERRLPILQLLPEPQQRKVRSLLSYNPETAGGLMSPDFLSLPADDPGGGRARRPSAPAPHPRGAQRRVRDRARRATSVGSASVVRLVQADPAAPFGSVCEADPLHIHADWDLGEIVRKMSDFNLTVVPVMDAEHRHHPGRGDRRRRAGAASPDRVGGVTSAAPRPRNETDGASRAKTRPGDRTPVAGAVPDVAVGAGPPASPHVRASGGVSDR